MRNDNHYWKRTPLKFSDQEGQTFCRLVDCSTTTMRKLSAEGRLYMLGGLYLTRLRTQGTLGYKLQKLVRDGLIFARTDRGE